MKMMKSAKQKIENAKRLVAAVKTLVNYYAKLPLVITSLQKTVQTHDQLFDELFILNEYASTQEKDGIDTSLPRKKQQYVNKPN